jgi:hypothetical protein
VRSSFRSDTTAVVGRRHIRPGRVEGDTVTAVSYRCSSCLDHTVERSYDVSHVSLSCPACGEFARFVHEGVLAKYQEFEETPPPDFDWERLDRLEKFVVAEGIVRKGRTLDDYDIEDVEPPSID